MAQGMGADSFFPKRGHGFCGLGHSAPQECVDPEAGERLASNVEEHRSVAVLRIVEAWGNQVCQDVGGVRPEGTQSDFASFPDEAHRRGRVVEVECTDGELGGFGGACAGVVEQEKQRVIPPTLRTTAIGYGEQGIDLRFLEIGHGR